MPRWETCVNCGQKKVKVAGFATPVCSSCLDKREQKKKDDARAYKELPQKVGALTIQVASLAKEIADLNATLGDS